MSALVHSSTLVTAGVYLVIRFRELISVNKFLLLVSVMTLFISGLRANFEFDLKKVIALSTLRQLGVIIMVLSLGMYELAFFHLVSHALFKSLLFLCAGVFIHVNVNTQDIRGIRSLGSELPLTRRYFVGCSLSLCGFPFLSGFYSKDYILESFTFLRIRSRVYGLIVVGVGLTVGYSFRLFYSIFLKRNLKSKLSLREAGALMVAPIGGLFLVSVVAGRGFVWAFLPPLNLFFSY